MRLERVLKLARESRGVDRGEERGDEIRPGGVSSFAGEHLDQVLFRYRSEARGILQDLRHNTAILQLRVVAQLHFDDEYVATSTEDHEVRADGPAVEGGEAPLTERDERPVNATHVFFVAEAEYLRGCGHEVLEIGLVRVRAIRQHNPAECRARGARRTGYSCLVLPRGAALVDWLAALPPRERDRAFEERYGIGTAPGTPPGEDMIGYVPSGVAPVVRAVLDAPITSADTVLVLGAGLGKAMVLIEALGGARVRGVEIQPDLAARCLARGLDVTCADAREVDPGDASVVYMYLPCTGDALRVVADRIAARCVCALGVDLPGRKARPSAAFWLSIYDAAPRPRAALDLGANAEAVAEER